MDAFLIAGVLVAGVLGSIWALAAGSRSGDRRLPKVSSRRLPVINSGGEASPPPGSVVVAGRTYEIVNGDDPGARRETCPWCLQVLVPGEDEIVRCPHPHCRQAGHRQHVEENGGCGGLCSLLG